MELCKALSVPFSYVVIRGKWSLKNSIQCKHNEPPDKCRLSQTVMNFMLKCLKLNRYLIFILQIDQLITEADA